MSNEIMGVVQEIKVKTVAGGKTAYDLLIAGKSYGVGFYAPKAKAGDYVRFEVDESRGYSNVARNSLKVSKNKPPAEATAEAEATAPKLSTAGGTIDMKQEVISRQSAHNTAIEFMKLLNTVEALGLPTGAKGNKAAALEAVLAKYTAQFYESNTGVKYKDITPVEGDKHKGGTTVEEREVEAMVQPVIDEDWT